MQFCVEKPSKGFATLQQAGEDLKVLPACGNRRLKRWCSISIQGARSKNLACNKQEKLRSASGSWQRLKRWCSISIQAARSKDLATEVTDKNDSRASGRWLPWSSRERQWATSLMDSWIFSVRSRSCSNDRWSCRTIASKADLEKEESWQQQPSIALEASHYFGLDNLLLEGVADRDWGITFSDGNGSINKQKLFSDLLFYKKWALLSTFTLTRFWDPRRQKGQLIQ